MKRVGLLLFMQETNSFNPVITTTKHFDQFGIATGAEVLSRFGDTNEIGGFVEGLRKARGDDAKQCTAEAVGVFHAKAWSGGSLAASAREHLVDSITQEISRARRLDALLVALHGALVSEDEDDVEGYVLETIRRIVGRPMPIVVTLDPHALLTARMIEHADVLVPYHTAPHVDQHETGLRAAAALQRVWAGANPAHAAVKLPMIMQAESQDTRSGALGAIFSRLRALEEEGDVLSAGVYMTQAWLDVPQLGWSAMVTTDGDPDRARQAARELAGSCWAVRNAGQVEFSTAPDSIDRALGVPGRPVIIADGADSTNSGACGDSTHLLREMIGRSIPHGALTFMVDAEAVQSAVRAGVGGDFACAVGGRRDRAFSKPLQVAGTVVSVRPRRSQLSGRHGNECSGQNRGRDRPVRGADRTGQHASDVQNCDAGIRGFQDRRSQIACGISCRL